MVQSSNTSRTSSSPAGWRSYPPELFFLVSAIAQYSGAVIAKKLFTTVSPGTVAWFRVLSAGIALVLVTRAWRLEWSRERLQSAAVFGIATAGMNLFFYLAIERLDLGIGVAIEFIGPISVAAVRTRTTRNAIAVVSAAAGVLVLAGLQFSSGDPLGLFFMLCASACWAGYIVFGAKVARSGSGGLASLGVGLLIGALVISPFGAFNSGVVWSDSELLLKCVAVGMLSSAIGYGMDQLILTRMSTRRYAVMLALLPVTAVFAGLLFLNESLEPLDLVGIALVLAGVVLQERDGAETLPSEG
jgi:inner membrane transporter RhtA